ncbi:MAG: tRNA dihydrouridine synthase DusB [Formosimonas sp.]
MHIGSHELPNHLFVAPMAGVTDRPFRQLCKNLGAGYAVSEMAASNPQLWATDKSTRRLNHDGETAPIAVQIAGSDPAMLAYAAQFNVDKGAQIIDINMGCPAKKVCNVAAGSALLRDEQLVARIVQAVVGAVDVPVTLKFRTGWDASHKNALNIAHIAQDAGIQMLTLHGRTRADGYKGAAEYDTIRAVKAAVRIPVVANGDITSPEKARDVLAYTGADAVMIGRAAQGRPWIFREIAAFLATGEHLPPPTVHEAKTVLLEHLLEHYAFYGERTGMLTARKHIGWYVNDLVGGAEFRRKMNGLNDTTTQHRAVADFFDELANDYTFLPYVNEHL